MKFAVGDKVKLKEESYEAYSERVGEEGVVDYVREGVPYPVYVLFPDNPHFSYPCTEDELELTK